MKKGEFFLKSVLCGALLATFNRLAVAGDSTDSTDTTQASSTSTENFTGYITEDFTGEETLNHWLMPKIGGGKPDRTGENDTNDNVACLTAGNVTTAPTAEDAGSPPECSPSNKDDVGKGALRLTPAQEHKAGGIISNFTFPTNNGVEIRFTTYSWGGTGADGMSFMLLDSSKSGLVDKFITPLGGVGGSLGYSCSQNASNQQDGGVMGGYLGIGIDEWGSFINGDDNAPSSYGHTPNTIGIRGSGSINYDYLANPKGFLQQVWTQHGWGTVTDPIANQWSDERGKEYWAKNLDKWLEDSNFVTNFKEEYGDDKFQDLQSHGKDRKYHHYFFRDLCKTGTVKIDGEFIPAGKGSAGDNSVTMSINAQNSQDKIYDYPLLAHVTIPEDKNLPDGLDTQSANNRDEATPINYRIKITPNGTLGVWYSLKGGTYQPIITEANITENNGPLPELFRFGFAGSTGGSTNNHDVICFVAAPNNSSEGSAETNLPEATYRTNAQVYSALYNPLYWTGNMSAQSILIDPSNGDPYIEQVPNWDASCNLTDGGCKTDTVKEVTSQGINGRNFFSWNGDDGIPLDWTHLSQNQKIALSNSDSDADEVGKERLAFLKGDRTKEATSLTSDGIFRKRRNVLADIINSSPTWVGYPNSTVNERTTWVDKLHASSDSDFTPEKSYAEYEVEKRSRINMIYVGANDGFLHAFRSGFYDASKNFQTKDAAGNVVNDGKELFAYMPAGVLSRIHNRSKVGLDYSNFQYAHNFYVDATPGTGDVYYNGEWHTWLLGGLGAGGNSMYALNITNPTEFDAGDVIGDWSYKPLDDVWTHLGNTYGTPVFGRFHDGNWGAVFGNGWCSTPDENNGNCTASDGPAGIYVMSIDRNTGTPSFYFLSTHISGTKNAPNGIAYATPYDVDDDGIIDYIYAGDLQGHVWRFNVNSDNDIYPWQNTTPQLIFSTPNGQPISTKILVSKSNGRIILNFGTGEKQEGYLENADEYATGTQSVYGVVDSTAVQDLNALNPVSGNTQVLATRNDLQEQTITLSGKDSDADSTNDDNKDIISQNSIDWATQKGWYLDLTHREVNDNIVYEQVIWNLELDGDNLIINTYIDDKDSIISCKISSASGYTYALDNRTGAGLSDFWLASNYNDSSVVVGNYRQALSASGTSSIIEINGEDYMIYKTLTGEVSIVKVNSSRERVPDLYRVSWREITL